MFFKKRKKLEKDETIPLIVQACPFCGAFPQIDCDIHSTPFMDKTDKHTFTWYLYCFLPECPVLLKTRHVSIRKKGVYDIEIVKPKFFLLQDRWNFKNSNLKKALLPISWKDYLRVVKDRIENVNS